MIIILDNKINDTTEPQREIDAWSDPLDVPSKKVSVLQEEVALGSWPS